jgi:hypothetical protein
MQPSGIASIAARVEIGEDHDSGVARSSREGTKRKVKARPALRPWPARMGRVPRIQTLRRPFFSKRVVSVAVVTALSSPTISLDNGSGSVTGYSMKTAQGFKGQRRRWKKRTELHREATSCTEGQRAAQDSKVRHSTAKVAQD